MTGRNSARRDAFIPDRPHGGSGYARPEKWRRAANFGEGNVGSFSVALNETHLYWTSRDDHRVLRVLKTGGISEVVARGQLAPFDIVARGTDVFFSKNEVHQNGVMRLFVP